MAKYEYAEPDDFMKAAKAAGAKSVGVIVVVKNEEGFVPVAVENVIVQGKRTSAVRLLTSVARQKDGSEDLFINQLTVLEQVLTSEEDADKFNKEVEKFRQETYALIQKEQLTSFHGRVGV